MGYDVYMEAQSFRPKHHIYWVNHETIAVDSLQFYTYDWKTIYRGPLTKENKALIKSFGKIPRRPAKAKDNSITYRRWWGCTDTLCGNSKPHTHL